jgi:hypothetical protein
MFSKRIPKLSKTRYLAGLHCPLRLWYTCYNRELATPVSPVQQALFDAGHQVGKLATRLHPGGTFIEEDHLHHVEAVKTTLRAMADERIHSIFEAGFDHDGVRVRVDILQRLMDKRWNLIEVKSSTSVKNEHIPDVGIQYHVLKGSGLEINQVFLIHLNNQYVYDGERLDLKHLFSVSDLTEEAISQEEEVPQRLAGLKEMLSRPGPPKVLPSRKCNTPYKCEFWEHCTIDIADHPIWELAGISQSKLDELSAMGIMDIRDIPGPFPLSETQERIRTCVKENRTFIEPDLKRELEDVRYPAHFLDFETVGPAIPRYKGTKPYQPIPFQWSDHILTAKGSIEHREFLHEGTDDPREAFAETLLEVLGREGTIVTYTGYEEGIIRGLAEDLPRHRDRLLETLDRIKDLHKTISKRYYHRAFHGSFSVKSVLPALLPEMSYDDLAIQDGQQAGLSYAKMVDPSTGQEERVRTKRELLTYCGHDTLAMVKIREELLRQLA